MFLTQEEIRQWSGRKYPKRQAKYFEENGYKFALDSHGRILILRSYAESVFDPENKKKVNKHIPNIQALRDHMNGQAKKNG